MAPAVRYNEKLSKGTAFAYSFLRTAVSGFDLTALGMDVMAQAMIVSVCKSFDFLLGFLVGTASDNVRTRWGRRKPFVALAFPLGVISMFFLVYPVPFARAAHASQARASPPLGGMELTSDYSERVTLFSVKVFCHFVGYMVPNGCGLFLAGYFANDVLSLYAALVIATLSGAALAVLLLLVHERNESADDGVGDGKGDGTGGEIDEDPPIPPVDNASLFFLVNVIILVFSFAATPVFWWLARRFGKRPVLLANSAVEVIIYGVGFVWPPADAPFALVVVIGIGVGMGSVVTFMVMDSMLADCIDYDAMHTGRRAEAVYTVAEASPSHHGGCECGCGVKCKAPYLRWSCPGDIAYACSDGFDAPPLYGDPDRLAPCVQQDSEGVLWTVRIFMLGLPHLAARRMSARPTGTDPLEWRRIVGLPTLLFIWALAAAWCTTLWRCYPISKEVHEAIIAASEQAETKGVAADPITGKPISRVRDSPTTLLAEHFWPGEQRRAAAAGSLAKGAAPLIAVRLGMWVAGFGGILLAVGLTRGDVQGYVVSFGAVVASALMLLMPYDAVRLRTALGNSGSEKLGTGQASGQAFTMRTPSPSLSLSLSARSVSATRQEMM
ncbi:hypothetical protein EMIHUDRAFT_118440 [Emiliania huxleyi CCMP1516]|uniref:Major facilitator superfamily associated domain-containing protein n=2 Tax=Emiliania huxleyi TaxID=2903 RepID=A0A0D3J2E3_EMIH1|nr:hypothetical protein EMIHUDRAFT_118440 [Emiliania huxleyi CCMP1516]EOD17678.1 hypothetical protein EMIHUDRAFT_118440 [Emiliania huxleyi CCMP1516]|eukprot:XP_005770107.1 hypothetical protein EMIHUDRAFT_118440 [Emiliania huxleyi CCMP1516]